MFYKIFNFIYQFLFVDQKQGHVSHTKFWSQVGYAVLCWAFCYTIIKGNKLDSDIWLFFGSVILGNRTILQITQMFKPGAPKTTP
jgi:uncharacterized membrane protein YjjP (DUF1212 family)